MADHVVIVGAGFAGALQAINLLRHDGPRATLIERSPIVGKGLAYGAARPNHLLNVRAGNMSAFPDDPLHFVRWLEDRGLADAAGRFVPRVLYGTYLQELVEAASRSSAGRFQVEKGDAKEVSIGPATEVRLSDGRRIGGDAVVLALGNLPPHHPPGLDPHRLHNDVYRGDPWDRSLTDGLGASDTVLLIGTGLTMVDVALTLEEEGFKGQILAVSRRGLTARRHLDGTPAPPMVTERPQTVASKLVRQVRTRSGEVGWRNAVDELRLLTSDLWRSASDEERARFLRHLRPWWDVHRHRLAPEVARQIDTMRESGRLRVFAGRTVAFEPAGRAADVTVRPRGSDRPLRLSVQRIVNCTGPQGDLTRTEEPLLKALVADGIVRPDSCSIGLDVNAQAQTIRADGRANETLYAVGPMTRGAFWEIVAVPDIRSQVWTLARRLSNAHWVEGEGL